MKTLTEWLKEMDALGAGLSLTVGGDEDTEQRDMLDRQKYVPPKIKSKKADKLFKGKKKND